MSVRPIWIFTLTLALPLLGGPAEAVPCSQNSCRIDARAPATNDARGLLSLQLMPSALGGWWYGVSHHLPVAELPPGLAKRGNLPSGLAKRDVLPPGLRTRIDWSSSAKPALVVALPGSVQNSGTDAPAVPEPTAAVLFASGLLVVATAARRVRRSAATLARV
jgi:hypothetical protein